MARRIFYFAGYRLKVFEWQGKELLGECVFEPTDAGFADFEAYLTQATVLPVQLLVDLIEEDFRREIIPHVGARDRKALVARLVDRLYRGEPCVHVMPLGRSTEGRRDDVLLLSALTNSEILAPWLTRLAAREIPLAGIWSVPLLSAKLLSACTAGEANILLLSQQIRTAYRETYFNNGQLVFSRQAKLERGLRDQIDAQGQAKSITSGSEQIRIFLTNQRTMAFSDKLYVYSIVPQESVAPLTELTTSSSGITYYFVPLPELYAHFKLSADITPKEDTLFSYLCACAPLTLDHYATHAQKKFARRLRADYWLGRASVLVSVLLLVAASFLWLYSADIEQRHLLLTQQQRLLDQRYQREYAPHQQVLDSALQLQTTVEFIRGLQREAHQSPDRLMARLAEVFSQPRFSQLQLDSLDWKKYPPGQLQLLVQQAQASVTGATAGEAEPATEASATADHLQASITLGGFLQRGGLSYRATVELMTQFAAALSQLPEIASVVVVRMPVDVRPPVTFVEDTGTQARLFNPQQEQENNHFEILLAIALPPPLIALDTEPSADEPIQPAAQEEPQAPDQEPSARGKEHSAQGKEPSARGKEPSAVRNQPSELSKESSANEISLTSNDQGAALNNAGQVAA
ncbi:MAG TPA: hypothetical protein VIZ65_05810 [Cellvibrionaceae bacterium]